MSRHAQLFAVLSFILAFAVVSDANAVNHLSGPVQAVNYTAPAAGLIAWWPADGDANDVVGGNNGSAGYGTTFMPGVMGEAFSFDGSNGYVTVPDSDRLNFGAAAPITIAAWIYRTGSSPIMHIIGKRDGCGNINYQMAFDYNGLRFDGYGGVLTGVSPPLNTWMHVAATFDGSTFAFYINGKLSATSTGVTLGPTNSHPLEIGASGDCAYRWEGLIDEVQIYNRALSSDEIAASYQSSFIQTTSSLTSIANPSVDGKAVTFIDTVTSAAGVPTGSVQFNDGPNSLGSVPVVDGSATLTTSALGIGSHPITALFTGEALYAASVSNTVTQQVNASVGHGTATTLTSTPNPSAAGQPATLTATVSGAVNSSTKPAGTVTFLDGAAVLATITLAGNGKASFVTAALSDGTHSLYARYNGNTSFDPSVSAVLTHRVAAPATITLASTPNPSLIGQLITFTANVLGSDPIPTGSVSFYDGSALLTSSTLDSKGATIYATNSLSAANHAITAVYSGNSVYSSATSVVLKQNVKAPPKGKP
jgi:hypothetical protein